MAEERHESRGSHQRPTSLGVLAFAVVLACVLWIVLVSSSINVDEIIVGAVSVVLTIIFVYLAWRSMGMRLQLRGTDLAQAWRIPWYIVSGIVEITWVLVKDLVGIDPAKNLFRVCGFDSSTHDAVRIGRTVLAVAYTTTAPNFIVVGIDPAQSRMLFHQVSASSVPLMTRNLGAKG